MQRPDQAPRHRLCIAVQARHTVLHVQHLQRRHVTGRHQAVDVGVREITRGKAQSLERLTDRVENNSEIVGKVVVTEVEGDEVWKTGQQANEPAQAAAVATRPGTVGDIEGTSAEAKRRQPITAPAAR